VGGETSKLELELMLPLRFQNMVHYFRSQGQRQKLDKHTLTHITHRTQYRDLPACFSPTPLPLGNPS